MDICLEPNYILSFSLQFFINQHSISQMSYLLFITSDINLQAQCQSISLSDPCYAPEQQPCRLSSCNSEVKSRRGFHNQIYCSVKATSVVYGVTDARPCQSSS